MTTLLERAQQYAAAVIEVKFAVKTIIEPVAPKAKVIPRWVWDRDGNTWAGLLRSKKDGDRVHAISIWYDGLDYADPEFSSVMRSVRPIIPLGITFFEQFDGVGTDSDNSEDRMMTEMAIVQMTLSQHPLLDLQGIAGHHGARIPKINFIPLGSTPAFSASARFRVVMDSRKTTV